MRIVIDSVSISFGTRVVLESFDAVFPAGQVCALVGPSGSGKSTLLAAIGGFLPVKSGKIYYDDGGVRRRPDPQMVGLVSQGANSLPRRTVLDNAMLGLLASGKPLRDARRQALDWLDRVGIRERAHEKAGRLSGGELQRVVFARALASGRPIILADEPSSSLDQANTDNIARLLSSLHSSSTIIVATHDPVLVAAAEYVVELRSSHGTS